MARKRILLVVVAGLLAAAIAALFAVRAGVFPQLPRGEPAVVAFEDLSRESGYVEVEGTAHYPVRVKQTFQPTWFHPEPPTTHVYPLFSPGDTMGRSIGILVLSQLEPDRLLGFQDRTVRGEIRPPNTRLLTRGVLDTFRDHAYEFEDGFLLLVENPPER